MATQVVTEQTPGLEIELLIESADDGPEGNFASGDDEQDRADVAEINRRLLNGDEFAWFTAHVRVTYQGYHADDYLGGCCYDNERQFRADGYYSDMVSSCLDQLNKTLAAIDACEMSPHNRAIIACVCGYKRRNETD